VISVAHRHVRVSISTALFLIFLLVTVGWTSGSAGASSSTPKPEYGGTLTFGGIAAVVSLDPGLTIGNSTAGENELEAIYGMLVVYNTKTNTFEPYMAKSLTHNADYTTWTLTIRPNIKFTDGSPYNAAAVVENIKNQMIPTSITASDFALLTNMTTPNDNTVVFTFSESFAGFPFVLARKNGAIAAPSYLAEVAAGDATATPIGAGPFTVQNFQPGVSVTLVANPNYWAGKPYLSGLKFIYIPGGPATYQAFQAGQLQAAMLVDFPSVAQAKAAGVSTYVALNPAGNTFNVNGTAGQPFSNQDLRVAVESAIDQNLQTINAGLFQDEGTMSPYIFPKGTPLYTSVPLPKESLTQEQAAVASAKSSLNWNGTLRLLCSNAPSSANEPTALEAVLKPLGLDFTVSLVSTAQEINIINITHQYDIACFGQGIPLEGPWLGLNSFLAPAVAGPRYGYVSPEMETLLNTLRTDSTVAAEKATLAKMQKLWFATVPFIPIAPGDNAVISAPNVHGLIHSSQATTFFDKAWLS
jgi:peptide/nickel transport system substrate-binding protein